MEHQTVRDALKDYYREARLEEDGGIQNPVVKIELAKGINIYIPNFDTRRKVVLRHDIHHLVTGYDTTMKGEAEIGAWELSTGCTHNWVAFTLNTLAMMTGVLFNFGSLWRAWSRGRRTKNLYRAPHRDEELLECNVEDLRNELGLRAGPEQSRGTFFTFIGFIGFLVFGVVFSVLSAVLLPLMLGYTVYEWLRRSFQ